MYFGENKKIIDHLIACYNLTLQIFSHIKIGMRFSEITHYALQLYGEKNFINTIVSSTDPTGTNIGHHVPSTEKDWSGKEREILKQESWEKVCKLISSKRIFLNETQQEVVKEGMALTIEPRPKNITDPTIPMVSFHTIGLFRENGKKELLTNFDKIFKLVGMEYMNS